MIAISEKDVQDLNHCLRETRKELAAQKELNQKLNDKMYDITERYEIDKRALINKLKECQPIVAMLDTNIKYLEDYITRDANFVKDAFRALSEYETYGDKQAVEFTKRQIESANDRMRAFHISLEFMKQARWSTNINMEQIKCQ